MYVVPGAAYVCGSAEYDGVVVYDTGTGAGCVVAAGIATEAVGAGRDVEPVAGAAVYAGAEYVTGPAAAVYAVGAAAYAAGAEYVMGAADAVYVVGAAAYVVAAGAE